MWICGKHNFTLVLWEIPTGRSMWTISGNRNAFPRFPQLLKTRLIYPQIFQSLSHSFYTGQRGNTAGRCPAPCKPFEKGLTLNFIAENCVFRGLKHKENPSVSVPQNYVLRKKGQGMKSLAGFGAEPQGLLPFDFFFQL